MGFFLATYALQPARLIPIATSHGLQNEVYAVPPMQEIQQPPAPPQPPQRQRSVDAIDEPLPKFSGQAGTIKESSDTGLNYPHLDGTTRCSLSMETVGFYCCMKFHSYT